jgi:hypothetical protein
MPEKSTVSHKKKQKIFDLAALLLHFQNFVSKDCILG